jgi:hypothetical protein
VRRGYDQPIWNGEPPALAGRLSHADAPWAVVCSSHAISDLDRDFIGSTIGGFIPVIWGDDMLSYSGVLFSGIGASWGCGSGRERHD